MICVYDLETTGLLSQNKTLPGIIQIAAILYDKDGNELSSFERRINPEVHFQEWEKKAIEVTGIGPDDINPDWPTFFSIFPDFADFVGQAKILAGYNITGYDDEVLFNNLCRYGFEKNFPWPRHRIEVMRLATVYNNKQGGKGFKYPKLEEIYKKLFDTGFAGAHDAMNDVRATGRVLFELGREEICRLTTTR